MTNTKYSIEPLDIKHADPLTNWFNTFVDQDLGVVENFHVTVDSERSYIEDYLSTIKTGEPMSYIISHDEIIVGKVDIRPFSRYIDKHVVELGFGMLKDHPEAGKQLLQFIEEPLKKRNLEVVLYFILARNNYFRELFKLSGFKEVGKIDNFYKVDEGYDARIILEKILK